MARMLAERPEVNSRGQSGTANTPTGRPVLAPAAPLRTEPYPVRQENSRVGRVQNHNLGWWSKETAATLIISFIASLLCLYVAAYAQVTAQGFEIKALTQRLEHAKAEEQAMQAAISKAVAPETIARRAATMEMVPGLPQAMNLLTRPVEEPSKPDIPQDAGDVKQTP